ncbi:MAG: dephospho-CoA kinase [Deltaproteobacteria bacterium]|nr:dephospho-CoA kinase [Deltaproteobacteria bacterium]
MVLGITGNIAAGKSTVARMLAARGAVVVSADELARQVVAPGSPTLKRLAERFGPAILTAEGSLDRQALGDIVFRDPEARHFLNTVTHAAIGEVAVRRLRELKAQGEPLIVYESPLLFEAKAEGRVDKVLVVKVSEQEQLSRLLRRPGMTPERAAAMIGAQMDQEQKAARGDFIIETNGTLEQLEAKVEAFLARLRSLEREQRAEPGQDHSAG